MAGSLEGLKVISLGSAWAGPYCGRMFSELGAQVFRIQDFLQARERTAAVTPPETAEAFKKDQLRRGVPEELITKEGIVYPAYMENYTPQNLGVGINIGSEKGKELFKDLVKISDIVIDGFSPTVMIRLGLDYSVLKEIKPDIIMISIPALGMTGPDMEMRAFGNGIEQSAGLPSITGYTGGPPHRSANYIADAMSAVFAATAILAAVNYRRKTGKGQYIDLAQAEVVTSMMGEAAMDYSMNKRVARPTGNRHPHYAPHGCYRCKGDDKWVAIAVTSEEEWQSFCAAIGDPEWSRDGKFSDVLGRQKNQDELDKLIEDWTIGHDHYAVQGILQKAGVAAGAVVSLEESILFDPQIKDRETYQYLRYAPGRSWPQGRVDPVFRVPWKMPGTPTSLTRPAPYSGEHNDYVFGELLGMSKEDMDKLAGEDVIGTVLPA